MSVADERWPAAVEAKALLQASLPDVGQHLNQKGGVHLRQGQQPAAAPRPTFAHRALCGWLQRIGWSPPVIEMMNGCYCAMSSSSLYHTTTSFHDSIVDFRSPPGMVPYDVRAFMQVNLLLLKGAFMRVNLLLLNGQM
uniref:Uncharacterized protein n=1 Tax=Oryza punctata TaxID=4537 RepID=A0A0E0K2W3_ORYPU